VGVSEFRVESEKYKDKDISKKRTMALDRVSIYAYICIGLVSSGIIGTITFAWIVLRKFRPIPRR
jgi:hypothetical protein